MKNLEIFFYYQGTYLIPATGIVCKYTINLELINLTFVGGRSASRCLDLLYSNDFLVTDCTFTSCNTGIDIEGSFVGKMTKLNLLNNFYTILVYGALNTPSSLEMDEIYTFNNEVDLWSFSCWSNLSLTNSQFNHGGGFVFLFDCDYTQQQQEYAVLEMKNCSFNFVDSIGITVNRSQNFEVHLTSCSFANSNRTIPDDNLIDIIAETTPTGKERNGKKIVLRNVTIEDMCSLGNSPPLLSLVNLPQVEFTNVHIRNNEMGALALYDTLAFFQDNNTFRNNSGYNGGAIALYGNSYIIVQANSTLEITNNTAENFGGGIYVTKEHWNDIGLISYCFVSLQGESAKVLLFGNQAKMTGAELYGGDIDTCTQIYNPIEKKLGSCLGIDNKQFRLCSD